MWFFNLQSHLVEFGTLPEPQVQESPKTKNKKSKMSSGVAVGATGAQLGEAVLDFAVAIYRLTEFGFGGLLLFALAVGWGLRKMHLATKRQAEGIYRNQADLERGLEALVTLVGRIAAARNDLLELE